MGIRRIARGIGALLVTLASIVATSHQVQADLLLLGSDGGGGNPLCNLYALDPKTGAVITVIGPTVDTGGNHYAITGLAYDKINGILYGSVATQSPTAPNSLVLINPLNALVTPIGGYGLGAQTMSDLTFDAADTLYGWVRNLSNDLATINTTTGTATIIADSGLGSTKGGGLAIDASGTAFLTDGSDTTGTLRMLNPASGLPTGSVPLTGGPGGVASGIGALAFGEKGVLYGADLFGSGFSSEAHLITINTESGVVTDVGRTVNSLDAIEFIPEPGSIVLLGVGLSNVLVSLVVKRRNHNRHAD